MKTVKSIFLIGCVIAFINYPVFSQELFEDACSENSITEDEKEIIKKVGYVIRPEKVYDRKYPLMPKEYEGDNKIRKYIKCQLKVVHNGISYDIFPIGKVIKFHYDGSIEYEQESDSLDLNFSEKQYSSLASGHFLCATRTFQILRENDKTYIVQDFIWYNKDGSKTSQGHYVATNKREKKTGKWKLDKLYKTGQWLIYNSDGSIKQEKNYKNRLPIIK